MVQSNVLISFLSLSITEWRPVTGSLPPFNQTDWDSEFAKYRASPEFIRLNPRMTLGEFKQIYWMEWTHRLWGRVIGVTILVPTIYFIARRRVAGHMALKLTGICGLIGFQGFLGSFRSELLGTKNLKNSALELPRHQALYSSVSRHSNAAMAHRPSSLGPSWVER